MSSSGMYVSKVANDKTTNPAQNRISDLGPTGQQLAKQLKRVRNDRGLDLRSLAERLRANGRFISASSLSKIENEARRVDADDLMALAVALDISPLWLLIDDEELPTTMPTDMTPDEVRAWALSKTHIARSARLSYWESRSAELAKELEELEAWRDRMLERPDSSANTRRLVGEQISHTNAALRAANERTEQLKTLQARNG